jgi:hypothetical protein
VPKIFSRNSTVTRLFNMWLFDGDLVPVREVRKSVMIDECTNAVPQSYGLGTTRRNMIFQHGAELCSCGTGSWHSEVLRAVTGTGLGRESYDEERRYRRGRLILRLSC